MPGFDFPDVCCLEASRFLNHLNSTSFPLLPGHPEARPTWLSGSFRRRVFIMVLYSSGLLFGREWSRAYSDKRFATTVYKDNSITFWSYMSFLLLIRHSSSPPRGLSALVRFAKGGSQPRWRERQPLRSSGGDFVGPDRHPANGPDSPFYLHHKHKERAGSKLCRGPGAPEGLSMSLKSLLPSGLRTCPWFGIGSTPQLLLGLPTRCT